MTVTLSPQNARVEAILASGGARAQDAVYKLEGSSEDSSGDEWVPVKRVVRAPRTG